MKLTLVRLKRAFQSFALASAALAPLATEGAPALRKINIGAPPIPPIHVAVKQKYFEQLGLDVNLIKFTSGPAQFAALAGGQIDLAFGGMGAFSLARANGQDIHFIALLVDHNPLQALVLPANSPVKSIKDLVGRKIALVSGSDAHYGTFRWLRKFGLSPTSVTILGMAPPQQVAALEKGDVDALHTWEPFITTVLEKGGRVLAPLQELDPGPAYLGWAAKRKWLDANGDVAIKLLKGWNLGLKKMEEEPELAVKVLLESTGMGESQARAMVSGRLHYSATSALDSSSPVYWARGSRVNLILRDFQAFGKEAGLIKKEIEIDDFVMTRFMQAVKDGK